MWGPCTFTSSHIFDFFLPRDMFSFQRYILQVRRCVGRSEGLLMGIFKSMANDLLLSRVYWKASLIWFYACTVRVHHQMPIIISWCVMKSYAMRLVLFFYFSTMEMFPSVPLRHGGGRSEGDRRLTCRTQVLNACSPRASWALPIFSHWLI